MLMIFRKSVVRLKVVVRENMGGLPFKDARLRQDLNRCKQKLSPRLRDKG